MVSRIVRHALIGFLFAVSVVGCNSQQDRGRVETEKPIDLKSAFSLAYDKIDRKENFRDDDFRLTVKKDGEGGWTFRFVFFPETPGDFFLAAVSKDGDVVAAPGL
ncbi:MAG: hypothetical protein ACKVHR_01905 [Pirellulales bacterium]|jgi:hypothetical protein